MAMAPRVSMILAIDNNGEAYVSLSQSNSNSSMMALFIKDLVRILDKENTDWRRDTIWFWDGAPYH